MYYMGYHIRISQVIHGNIDMSRVRNEKGIYIQKGEEVRLVRSLRLTDSTWEKIGSIADAYGVTKADLIEETFRENTPKKDSNSVELNELLALLKDVKEKVKNKETGFKSNSASKLVKLISELNLSM